jgi:uncharacterized secreted protein with C-terminal beta-propeller domain
MEKESKNKYLLIATAVLIPVSIMIGASLIYLLGDNNNGGSDIPPKVSAKIERFKSEKEFKEFLEQIGSENSYGRGGWEGDMILNDLSVEVGNDSNAPTSEKSAVPEMYSATNVQVLSIDEPDLVKTDGNYIYISNEQRFYIDSMPAESEIDRGNDIAPYYGDVNTTIIKAFPVEELSKVGDINVNGEMILHKDMLVVFDYDGVEAYDVSDPYSPSKKWDLQFDSAYRTARLYNGELFIVTTEFLQDNTGCDLPVLSNGDDSLTVPCTNIYHPQKYSGTDSVINVVKINPSTGKVNDSISFVGSNYSSVVYMSEDYVYVSYPQNQDEFSFIYEFASINPDLFSPIINEKIEKLNTYDISSSSKMSELESILNDYTRFMNNEERANFDNKVSNELDEYVEENKRSISYTGIVKLSSDTLDIEASGVVPGTLLNQFSLDEYEGNLRMVTTIGSAMWWGILGGSVEEENDLYILDHSLDIKSSIQGMGLDERIYSARFVGDQAYMVTFKQIDPFFVFDLSDPSKPELKGELKIPGYSSYLHPIDSDTLVGVGEEGGRVKISLFDVSDPTQPKEVSKFLLDEYWSEVETNHHAFTIDYENDVFFIPTSGSGYVIGYNGDKLIVKAEIDSIETKRALYIDDMLYVISEEDIRIFDESTWEEISSLRL